jgi:hypothetical protein
VQVWRASRSSIRAITSEEVIVAQRRRVTRRLFVTTVLSRCKQERPLYGQFTQLNDRHNISDFVASLHGQPFDGFI